MKKLVTLTMAAALAASLVACGGTQTSTETKVDEATEQASQTLGGGWQMSEEGASSLLTPEEAEIFQKAMGEIDGVSYEPVCVVGQQVVAGMNYAYLCKATPTTADAQTEWSIVVIYAALDGSATFTSASPLDLADVHVVSEDPMKEAVGAWEAPVPANSATLPTEVADAFAELDATGTYELVPQAVLGSQVVAGTNYQVLCIGREKASENTRNYAYDVTVYVNLDGKAEVSSVQMIDLISYVSPSA